MGEEADWINRCRPRHRYRPHQTVVFQPLTHPELDFQMGEEADWIHQPQARPMVVFPHPVLPDLVQALASLVKVV